VRPPKYTRVLASDSDSAVAPSHPRKFEGMALFGGQGIEKISTSSSMTYACRGVTKASPASTNNVFGAGPKNAARKFSVDSVVAAQNAAAQSPTGLAHTATLGSLCHQALQPGTQSMVVGRGVPILFEPTRPVPVVERLKNSASSELSKLSRPKKLSACSAPRRGHDLCPRTVA